MVSLCKYFIFSTLFCSSFLLAKTGGGTSGGGNAREELWRGMSLKLVQFAENANFTSGSTIDQEALLDGIDKKSLTEKITKSIPIFLDDSNIGKTWAGGRFSWDGESVTDHKEGLKNRDGAYIGEIRGRFRKRPHFLVVESNWNKMSIAEKYLFLRKENWRMFSKQDAPNMRAYIIDLFNSNKLKEADHLARTGDCKIDGTLKSFKNFEGLYSESHDSNGLKQYNYQLLVDLDSKSIALTHPGPYWYRTTISALDAKGFLKESYLPFINGSRIALFGQLSDSKNLTKESRNSFWLRGSTADSLRGDSLFYSITVGCDDGGRYIYLPKVQYIEHRGIYSHLTYKIIGFSKHYGINQSTRDLQIQDFQDKAEDQIKEYEAFINEPTTDLKKICDDYKVFGGFKLRFCDDPKGVESRIRELIDNAFEQLDFFAQGIKDPQQTYGDTRLTDRVYSKIDGRAIYSYDLLNIVNKAWKQPHNQICMAKNNADTCYYFHLSNILWTVNHNSENIERFDPVNR